MSLNLGLSRILVLINALITRPVKCGDVWNARLVFDTMAKRYKISWNAMVSCYFENMDCLEALIFYLMMLVFSINLD